MTVPKAARTEAADPLVRPIRPELAEGTRLTDVGNAERLVLRHGERLRYCHKWGSWLVWDGRRWAVDDTGDVMRRAKDTVQAIYTEASAEESLDQRRRIAQHAVSSEKEARLCAMIALAESDERVIVRPDQFNRDPWLLNLHTGTLDLRTGAVRPHDRGDLLTQLVPIDYDANAVCPRWIAFLDRITAGNRHLSDYLQRAAGYTLTGSTQEQCFFLLYGSGANGKTTFLEVLRLLLGEYARQADFATFLQQRGGGPRNDVARLLGARVVTSCEAGEGKRLDESLVKVLTGGDMISARRLYHESFEFVPEFKMWLGANHKPDIRESDEGMWRRVRLIPFTVCIPLEERDRHLVTALRAELPGILTWTVVGCMDWRRQGLGEPGAVLDATTAYRREVDRFGAFLADRCVLDPFADASTKELYTAYVAWAEAAGERAISLTRFGVKLTELGFGSETRGRNKQMFRLGLQLAGSAGSSGDLERNFPTAARFVSDLPEKSPQLPAKPQLPADDGWSA